MREGTKIRCLTQELPRPNSAAPTQCIGIIFGIFVSASEDNPPRYPKPKTLGQSGAHNEISRQLCAEGYAEDSYANSCVGFEQRCSAGGTSRKTPTTTFKPG